MWPKFEDGGESLGEREKWWCSFPPNWAGTLSLCKYWIQVRHFKVCRTNVKLPPMCWTRSHLRLCVHHLWLSVDHLPLFFSF